MGGDEDDAVCTTVADRHHRIDGGNQNERRQEDTNCRRQGAGQTRAGAIFGPSASKTRLTNQHVENRQAPRYRQKDCV